MNVKIVNWSIVIYLLQKILPLKEYHTNTSTVRPKCVINVNNFHIHCYAPVCIQKQENVAIYSCNIPITYL